MKIIARIMIVSLLIIVNCGPAYGLPADITVYHPCGGNAKMGKLIEYKRQEKS